MSDDGALRVVLCAALGLPSQPKDTAILAMEGLRPLGLNLCCLVKHYGPMPLFLVHLASR